MSSSKLSIARDSKLGCVASFLTRFGVNAKTSQQECLTLMDEMLSSFEELVPNWNQFATKATKINLDAFFQRYGLTKEAASRLNQGLLHAAGASHSFGFWHVFLEDLSVILEQRIAELPKGDQRDSLLKCKAHVDNKAKDAARNYVEFSKTFEAAPDNSQGKVFQNDQKLSVEYRRTMATFINESRKMEVVQSAATQMVDSLQTMQSDMSSLSKEEEALRKEKEDARKEKEEADKKAAKKAADIERRLQAVQLKKEQKFTEATAHTIGSQDQERSGSRSLWH